MLTAAQLTTLRADIAADSNLNGLPLNSDAAQTIADTYNQLATPDFLVWMTNVSTTAILDSITWVNFTPIDAVASSDTTLTFADRLLLIQTKQMNLQTMLQGRITLDASKANLRAGLRDSVVALPAGVSGANVSAGGASGATVLNACLRQATRAEKLFSSGSAQTGTVTGNLLTFEGRVSSSDVVNARAN